MDQLTTLLQQVQSPNSAIREPAERQLISFEQNSFPEYLRALVSEFSTETKPEETRVAAALQVKRILTGQDDLSIFAKREHWNALDSQTKNFVKEASLRGLTSSVKVGKQAAQIVEAVAKYELISGSWPDLIEILIKVFDQVFSTDKTRVIGPLLAIGYFCGVAADANMDISEQQVNTLLGKIAIGMDVGMPEEVQVAATQALSDTLDFARHNMDSKDDRDKIVGLVLSMTQPMFPAGTKEKAFQCLATVLQLYYHLLPEYMEQIWTSTYSAIHGEDEQVAKQALNFWAEMCLEESERSSDPTADITDRNLGFIFKVQTPLCDLVLNYCLLHQDAEPDDDERTEDTLYGAAEHCFVYLCNCLGSSILAPTFEYIQKNMMLEDWRRRQAAVFALGAIVIYNGAENIAEAVNQTLPYVLQRTDMKSEQVASVRETAAWAVSNMCSEDVLPAVNPALMEPLLLALLLTLQNKPRVAHMGATSIHCLANSFSSEADLFTNRLSGKPFETLASALWTAAQRPDADQWQLMEDAYEAIMKLIEVSATDMNHIVGNDLLGHSLMKLSQIQRGEVHDTTGFLEVELCGVVVSCCLKLKEQLLQFNYPPGAPKPTQEPDAPAIADAIVQTMIAILQKSSSNAHADALQAIGEVINIVGSRYAGRYADAVMPHIMRNLTVRQNAQVCIAAVRLLSDIVTAMQGQVAPLVEELMKIIFTNLGANDLQKEVKPPHLIIMGDIAEAVGPTVFKPFFKMSMTTAIQASMFRVDVTDEEYSSYLNVLREASLESMEMMLLDAQTEDLGEFLQPIYQLACTISKEISDPRNYYINDVQNCPPANLIIYRVSDGVLKSMLGILGDVSQKMRGVFTVPLRQNMAELEAMFSAGKACENQEVRDTAIYTLSQINSSS